MIARWILLPLRRFNREKLHFIVSLISLSVGFSGVLVLILFLKSELSYDRHHVEHENIYRLITRVTLPSGLGAAEGPVAGYSVGPLMVQDFPEMGQFVRFFRAPENMFRHEQHLQAWTDVYHADASVFDVFTHAVLEGDLQDIFQSPNEIAVSERFANTYFGNESALGKTIEGLSTQYRVVLVYENLPENTHLKYDALLPLSALDAVTPGFLQQQENLIWSAQYLTYFRVNDGFDPDTFPEIAASFYQHRMKPSESAVIEGFRMELQPLADVHFGEAFMNDQPVGNIYYVYGFTAVAVFLLLICALNYVNLAVAQMSNRRAEIAVRKILGANGYQLGWQFISEALLLSVLAVVMGYGLATAMLSTNLLAETLQKAELLETMYQPENVVQFFGVAVTFGVLAGAYPAFLFGSSAIKTGPSASVLTGKRFSTGQLLVLIQLAGAVGIAACASLMAAQVNYLNTKPLGFVADNRIAIQLRGADTIATIPLLKDQLLRELPIEHVSAVENLPGTGNAISIQAVETESGATEDINLAWLSVDQDYLETMGIPLLQGDGFASSNVATRPVVVNETLVRQMGWDNPLGKRIGSGTVTGVVGDIHYRSLNDPIAPMTLWLFADDFESLTPVRRASLTRHLIISPASAAATGDVSMLVGDIRRVLTQVDENIIVDPLFLNASLQSQYVSESSLSRLIITFSVICIAVSMMGLYGVLTYIIDRRRKEIGIRRVAGADALDISRLLAGNLVPVIALASVPSSLLGFYAASSWLARFAYRIDISLMYFVNAFAVVAGMTLLMIVIKAVLVTHYSPGRALRSE